MKALFDVRGLKVGEVREFYGENPEPPLTANNAPASRQDNGQGGERHQAIHQDTPKPHVTDNLCAICGRPVPGKRQDRLYCSAGCRKRASRMRERR